MAYWKIALFFYVTFSFLKYSISEIEPWSEIKIISVSFRFNEHKRATKNDSRTNRIVEHYRQTNHSVDWEMAECTT